jgi:hypothetical protein
VACPRHAPSAITSAFRTVVFAITATAFAQR